MTGGANWTVRVHRGGFWVDHDFVFAAKKDADAFYRDMWRDGWVMGYVVATDKAATHRWTADGAVDVD